MKREAENIKTELYDAIYKTGELILSRISEAGLSATTARHDSESELPARAQCDIRRALNI